MESKQRREQEKAAAAASAGAPLDKARTSTPPHAAQSSFPPSHFQPWQTHPGQLASGTKGLNVFNPHMGPLVSQMPNSGSNLSDDSSDDSDAEVDIGIEDMDSPAEHSGNEHQPEVDSTQPNVNVDL